MQRNRVIAPLVAAIVGGCGGTSPTTTPPVSADVATYRGDAARTGLMPGPGPSGQPALAWQFDADGPIRSSPVSVGGSAFVTSESGIVFALDLDSGEERWHVALGSDVGAATPLVAGGLVILGDRGGILHALDVATGAERWRATLDGAVAGAAALAGGLVLVGTESGSAYGLEPSDGQVRWRASLPGGVSRSIAATADAAYYPLAGGRFVALRTSDGSRLWLATLATDGDGGTPTIVEGIVFAPVGLDTDDVSARALVALDAVDGRVLWRRASPAGKVLYAPAVAGGVAYVVAEDETVVALEASTGAEYWTATTGAPNDALPAVWQSMVVVATTGGTMQALDTETGALLWQVGIQGVPYAPIVTGGYVLVGTNVGVLYAFADAAR
jgi:outer membrane protein assembly factor BamB